MSFVVKSGVEKVEPCFASSGRGQSKFVDDRLREELEKLSDLFENSCEMWVKENRQNKEISDN
jgi:hypothetical protein